jgi:hypothetical protein
MIDDYAKAQALVRKMEAHLPIPARAGSELARLARQKNLPIARNRELSIKRVFCAGDEGGILCDVTPEGEVADAVVCSLTHLEISPGHPLAEEIQAYQRTRTLRLAQANQGWPAASSSGRRLRRR